MKLNSELAMRKKKNARFSLRSYSRLLGINSGTLSRILAGKRRVSALMATSICQKLKFSENETQLFLESVLAGENYFAESETLQKEPQKTVLENWEHLLILALCRLDGFVATPEAVAEKLNITPLRAETCLNELLQLGLLKWNADHHLQRHVKNINSSHNVYSRDAQRAHRMHLEMAKEKLDQLSVHERNFLYINVALDQKHFQKLKKMMLKFRQEVFDLDEVSPKERVYRVAFQCFPVSN